MNIVLIGVMGSGKTSVGKELSNIVGYGFLDMDKYIEEKNGMTITEMFEVNEAFFREKEERAAYIIGGYDRTIIATGGGVVKNPNIMESLCKNAIIIYIKRDIASILETSNTSIRPVIANDPQKLYGIFEERKPLYERYGQICVENSSTVNDCAKAVVRKLEERGIVL